MRVESTGISGYIPNTFGNQRTIAGSGYFKTSESKNHSWFRVFENIEIKEPSLVPGI
jgi:hypothetical protein